MSLSLDGPAALAALRAEDVEALNDDQRELHAALTAALCPVCGRTR